MLQQIFEFMGTLPTGHFTIGALLILVLLAVLWMVNECASFGLKYLLAFDVEGAPKVDVPNIIGKVVSKLPITKEYWTVVNSRGQRRAYNYISLTTGECLLGIGYKFSSEVEALKKKNPWFGSVEVRNFFNWNIIRMLLLLDIAFFLFGLFPTLTITISAIAGICWGIRFLAKKVWQNTSKIGGHEERIKKLEGEDS